MCGRFTLTIDPAQLVQQFNLSAPPPADLGPRYNIAPTQPVAVIANEDGPRKLELFQWGLIPSWAKDAKIGNSLINARAETLAEKPAFRTALKRRRCLVLADGFYEWQKLEGRKQPMYIQLKDGQPFAFAGLWETWRPGGADSPVLKTCTIITTEPNALTATIHNRMPVILPPADYEAWLTPGELPAVEALALLHTYPAEAMQARPVSTAVNSPAHDSETCIQPLAA
jgi:putative SOS response-associated peptidase YedK